MKTIPWLIWNRRHNVATLGVSFSGRIWDTREVGDTLILGYNAIGRLAKIVFLDPNGTLPRGAGAREAVATAVRVLIENGAGCARDLEVLGSAHRRASVLEEPHALGAQGA